MNRQVRIWLASAFVIGLLLGGGGSALAQETGPHTQAPKTIEAISVTAEKREIDLQETGLSIQAFSSGDIDRSGMAKSEDIGGFTPGFQFIPATGSNSQVAFAGRGSVRTDNHPINEQSVGLYIDGIYHGTGEASLFELMDIERVEVLKGPQGTLFGRNTIGGAISIVSKKPQPEFGGSATVGFGQNRYFGANAMLNVPLISERLLSRISVMRKKRDPFTRNKADRATAFPTLLPSSYDDNDDQDAFGFRGALRYLANDDFTIDYSFDYLEHDQHTPAFAVSGGSATFLPFKETDNGDIAADGANLDREIVKQHSLNMEWQASENLTLRSITGWRRYDGSRLSDLDGTTATFTGTQGIAHFRNKVWTRSFYQELQLVGTTLAEHLDYTLGFNWFEDESEILNRGEVFNPGANNVAEVKGDNYSWGLYGQMNYRFTERLELTLGLRYSSERREAEHSLCRPTAAMLESPDLCPPSGIQVGRTTADGTPGTGGAGSGVLGLKDSVRFDNWSPMARLSYDWTDDVMTYLSWSRGYRAGGFPNRPADGTDAAFTPYKEETISQWEIGLKSRFLGDRLQLNGSAYYSEYEDQQVSSLLAGSIVTKTENAGKSRLRGWELEARAVPLEGLELRVAHGYTNTDFSEFGAVDMMGNPINIADQRCVCQQPKRTWSGWATYTLPTDLGTFQLTGSFRRNSWAAFDSRRASSRPSVLNIEQSSFTVYGAQARLLDAFGKDGMSIAVIGRNITDTVYAVNGIDFSAFQGLSYGDPRHWIVEVGYEF